MDRQTIEVIRISRAKGAPISSIAQSLNLQADDVEKALNIAYQMIDPYTEALAAIDSYSVMIQELSSMIFRLKNNIVDGKAEEKSELNDKDSKQILELLEQKQKLQEAKVKLLTEILSKPQPKVKQVDLSTYEKLEEPTQKYRILIYKIMSAFSSSGYNRTTFTKASKKTRKTIRKVAGCTIPEFKECIRLIKEKNIPTPKTDIEHRLRKQWI